LLKATTSSLPTVVEWSSEAEEARVGSSRGASPVIETTAEVADTASEMPVRPPTTELLPESGTEKTAPPTVDETRLPSPQS